jgi:hypothetical protein
MASGLHQKSQTGRSVTLPPGLFMLPTKPTDTGSLLVVKTMGIVSVAAFATRFAGLRSPRGERCRANDTEIPRADTKPNSPGLPGELIRQPHRMRTQMPTSPRDLSPVVRS